ncbi:MAG: xanthine dehydrogenase family protein molybdopterin-binding subunit [Rudaea sp.]|uniref:xanthine dehydrogenase family protein molybdopterin-binding subunit n=1 Tax=unclassified Rudaea TaxID=2627037 RepID=UPI0010F6B365|nr:MULTISPECIES: molybdopterin cofactor-binding domain-containing protein [unclassified Rudaea]MBN8888517.1 xanthine dehydrogenase family protein molybdopterin-binding subunit [Rudaea sp.]MBR0346248.1 xanthine dehydrogenase family protein molybdopterin-binding subunit [Rudaea sp.]
MNAASISRRKFLETSALVGGGLIVGLILPSHGLLAKAAAGDAKPVQANAWVRIAPDDTITLICHRNEMGQDVHTSLALLIAEELEVDVDKVKIEQAPVDPVYVNALLGAQITGGSTSVRDAWTKLREAGATARIQIVAAAANEWKVAATDCVAKDGAVSHGDKRKRYGELAAAAAKLPAPAKVELKTPAQFTQIGKHQHRLDAPAKARGKAIFGIDASQPGMVYASLEQCPVIGGKVASVDDAKAKAMPGVRAVVNIGEGVAVVADHYWNAKKAREALAITWDYGPGAGLDNAKIEATLKEGAKQDGSVIRKQGDVEAALKTAAKKIDAEYRLQLLAHATLEPMNCLALVSDAGCDIWTSTQFPQGAQGAAAARSGVPAAKVRIFPQFIGGGFGRRLDVDFIGQAAAIAKAMPGTPVKLIWTREDDTRNDFYRPASYHALSGGLDAKGDLVAFDYKFASASVTNRMFPGVTKAGLDPLMTEGAIDLTYDIANERQRVVIQEFGLRVGYWRSVSHALNAFAIEGFIDELAHAAGKDPVAFRVALLGKQPRQRAVLERVAKEAGWGRKLPAGSAQGIASMESYGTHQAVVADISKTANGAIRIDKLTYAVDPGIAVHPDQVIAQIQGGAVSGLINTLSAKITLKDGRVVQSNFHDFQLPRMNQMPKIDVVLMPSGDNPGGMGEVGVPLVAPAIANAVFALTGQRVRTLPLADAKLSFA